MTEEATSKIVSFQNRKKRGPVTAGELIARLESDPDYVARRDEYMRQWRAAVEENIRAAAPVEADLRKAGVHVSSVNDLIYCRLRDVPAAIPVLLRWLPKMENLDIKDCIIRALTDKAARPLAAPALIEEFRKNISDLDVKWAIGNALSVVSDDLVFEDLVELLRDKRHGAAREGLALALLNVKRPENRARAEEALLEVAGERPGQGLDADYTAVYAVRALARMRSSRAKPLISRLLDHPERDVRKTAERALASIEKAEQKAREKEAKRKRQ
jgi:hypothetical protein